MKPIITPEASGDVDECFLYIAADSPEAAFRFLSSADETFLQLAETPRIGRRCDARNPNLKGLRRWPVRGFENFLVFYLEREGVVHIIRVLHGARDIEAILADT